MNASAPIAVQPLPARETPAYAALLERSDADIAPYLDGARTIIDAVKVDGDAALLRFARDYDGAAEMTTIRQPEGAFEAAEARLDDDLKAALRRAHDNVRRFHERHAPEPMRLDMVSPGVLAGERVRPIPSVACYAPRGKGAFPSTVIMTATIAAVAGVPRRALFSPPTPAGTVDDATLFAARLCGVHDVYAVGGAQAVAAAAYGTESVPRCAKIVGPGSLWFVAAKQLLADRIDGGLPAGPSEAVVLALGGVDGRLAALDLIIESEHGPDSGAFLVTENSQTAQDAVAALETHWAAMDTQRAEWSRAVIGGPRGGVLLAPDADAAIAFCNDYAAEHLQILAPDPFDWLDRIEHAGEILLGSHAPSTLGNFVLGPSHVLPTGGWAKTASALSVQDFVKRTTVAHVSAAAYPALAADARTIALYEGFDGHARAVSEPRDALLSDGT